MNPYPVYTQAYTFYEAPRVYHSRSYHDIHHHSSHVEYIEPVSYDVLRAPRIYREVVHYPVVEPIVREVVTRVSTPTSEVVTETVHVVQPLRRAHSFHRTVHDVRTKHVFQKEFF